jgi:hypothetical protein
MRKPRPDSLYARLAAADPSLELREWVFYAAIIEGKSYEEIGGELHDKGVHTSDSAIAEMVQRHSLRWKLDKSREAAREVDKWEPDKKQGELPEQLRRNIAKRLFEKTFEDLSTAEVVAIHRSLSLETRANAALYKVQFEAADFLGAVLKDERKAAELRELAKDSSLTTPQYIEAVRQRMYAKNAVPMPQNGKEAE